MSGAYETLAETPKLSSEEYGQLMSRIIDILPDSPHQAMTVLAMTYANVTVSTECPVEQALAALRTALAQRRRM